MDTYRIKDLYLAAFLYSEGVSIVKLDRSGTVCWFNFGDKTRCEQLASNYWADTASVRVKSYTDSLRTLKDLIFAQ